MRAWLFVALAALVAGCVPVDRVPARDAIGVSAATGKAADDAAAQKLLAWKANQVCTVPGYEVQKKDVAPAEGQEKILDWQLRCEPYAAMTPIRF
ncbi:MAG: hypothetical protein KGL22_05550 [Alphaproteobacteria bacterium]|nr:hypothetical protein [Alphaproteobacteria bacterium]